MNPRYEPDFGVRRAARESVQHCADAPVLAARFDSPIRPEAETESSPTPPSSVPACRTFHHGCTTRVPLYAHQAEGVEQLIANPCMGLGDDPGLGKTAQALFAFKDLKMGGRVEKLIVCCRARHGKVWEHEIANSEFRRDFGHFRVASVIGKPAKDRILPDCTDVYLINYELLSRKTRGGYTIPNAIGANRKLVVSDDVVALVDLLKRYRCMLVCDESQAIANPRAHVTRVLCSVGKLAVRRALLTGTVVSERPWNVWAQAFFLDHGATFGRSYAAFLERHAVIRDYGQYRKPIRGKNLRELHRNLSHLFLRRTVDKCLDLPGKLHKTTRLTPYGPQAALLDTLKRNLIDALEALKADGFRSIRPGSGAAYTMVAMQRAAAMPSLVDTARAPKSVKLDEVVDLLETSDGPIVVWCVHRDVTEAFAHALNRKLAPNTATTVTGAVSDAVRWERQTAFKDGRVRVLCATVASMSEAVTLTNAAHAVYVQRDFSLLYWTQSQDRIYRIGQTKSVVIEVLELAGYGLDGYISEALRLKRDDARTVQGDTFAVDESIGVDSLLRYLRNL